MTVCDNVCLSVCASPVGSQSSLVDEIPLGRDLGQLSLFWKICLEADRRIFQKVSSCISCF